jgi:hypothetical protein
MARGKLTLSQLQSRVLTGDGSQITTFGGGAMTPGAGVVWDAGGNLITGTLGATHTESLTDGAGNFIFANGDAITVVGVPN